MIYETDLILQEGVNIMIADNMHIKGNLDLTNATVVNFPSNLVIDGNLILTGSSITEDTIEKFKEKYPNIKVSGKIIL